MLALDALASLFTVVPLSEYVAQRGESGTLFSPSLPFPCRSLLDQRLFSLLAAYAEVLEPDARLGSGALKSV